MKWKDVTRVHVGWAMYDWANSAFATSILAFVYAVYFIDNVACGDDGVCILGVTVKGSTLWPVTIFISFLIIALLAPFLGAVADRIKAKKRFLFFFCYLGAASTCALFFVAPGRWQLGMVLFILGNIGFVSGNVFYNGLLKDISTDENIGFLSGLGWGVGYLGGFILLIANLVMIMFWEPIGFPNGYWAARTSFLTVGIWWGVFAIPLFLFVKEDRTGKTKAKFDSTLLTDGIRQLKSTVTHLPAYPVLLLFLVAFFLFNDAIQTTISQASNFGTSVLNMSSNKIIIAGILIQFVAIIGSFGFLRIERTIGTMRSLQIALCVWVFALIWAFLMQTWYEFYIMAAVIGLVLGVSQSAARTLFGQFIPKERAAEFFSFYSIVGKVSAVIGPGIFAVVDFLLETRYTAIPLGLMVLIGLLLLFKVDVKKGIKQASGQH